ncbi:hypothetical protein [Viridibacterium curvum]|uniref:Uncharacterized protein n=1 Tax=Viridibacterium curvum TaxID=1101404 RepID=A0ABP9QVA7_9RHOO
MKFKPVLPGVLNPAGWKWRQRRAQKRARRAAAIRLDGLFPLSFVPESSVSRRTI